MQSSCRFLQQILLIFSIIMLDVNLKFCQRSSSTTFLQLLRVRVSKAAFISPNTFPWTHDTHVAFKFQPTLLFREGHEGPVWQVAWAHPKFGSLIASCSYDRKVIVWKEASERQWVQVRCDHVAKIPRIVAVHRIKPSMLIVGICSVITARMA